MPEYPYNLSGVDLQKIGEPESPGGLAAAQNRILARPAPTQAVCEMAHTVREVKRTRSVQDRGAEPCDEGQGLFKRQKSRQEREPNVPTAKQVRQPSPRKQKAKRQGTSAIFRDIKSMAKDIRKMHRIMDRRRRRRHRTILSGQAALRVQGLREDGRQRALAHLGISSSAIAPDSKPWGQRIVILVKNWTTTWEYELTPPQRKEITDHFGSHFVSFVNSDVLMLDLAKAIEATSFAYPYSHDMPWAERCFIMEAIDDLWPKAERDGGRIAYLAFFGGLSWKKERKRVFAKLRTPE